MNILGKNISEYLSFQKVFLVLIILVGLTRLSLSLAGMPNSTGRWFSLTVVGVVGWLYYSIAVPAKGFGTYKHLLPLLVIQNALTQLIAVTGIAIAIFTGKDNIFSAPEFSGAYSGKSWAHAGGHILIGVIVLSLLQWLIGSGIMFIAKKFTAGNSEKISSAAAK